MQRLQKQRRHAKIYAEVQAAAVGQHAKEPQRHQYSLAREAAHADDGELDAERAQAGAPQLQVARRLEGGWPPRWGNEPDALA